MDKNKIFKYGKDIVWSLPILFQYEPVWRVIYNTAKEYGIELPNANGFGCPGMAWYGGRLPNIKEEVEPRILFKIFNYCREMNITPALTFNRILIDKDDLKDKYANYILDMALETKCHFIVCSDLLKNYIKEKDSNAHITASIIQTQIKFQGENAKNWSIENETNHYNNLLKEYDMVVVRPEYSMDVLTKNPDFIDDISKIEILVNQRCIRNCPKVHEHYLIIEKYDPDKNFKCIIETSSDRKWVYDNCVSHDEKTIQKLVDNGIKHIKLQGRGIGLSNLGLAMMLFARIFDQGGGNHHILERILVGSIDQETYNFAQWLNKQF